MKHQRIPDTDSIDELARFWDAHESIPWVRVYVLPRFVHFSHEAHVRASVTCADCHGEVQRMDRVTKVRELTMGWCMECHRQRAGPDDCLTCHY